MGVSGDAQAYTQIRNWWNNILPVIPHLKIGLNTGPTNPCEIKNSDYIGDYVNYGNAHPYHSSKFAALCFTGPGIGPGCTFDAFEHNLRTILVC